MTFNPFDREHRRRAVARANEPHDVHDPNLHDRVRWLNSEEGIGYRAFLEGVAYYWPERPDPASRSDWIDEYQRKLNRINDISYQSVHHDRLPSFRGRARDRDCVACSGPAAEWAFLHDSKRVLKQWVTNRLGVEYVTRYSADVSDYVPMCHPCHVGLDRSGDILKVVDSIEYRRRQALTDPPPGTPEARPEAPAPPGIRQRMRDLAEQEVARIEEAARRMAKREQEDLVLKQEMQMRRLREEHRRATST